jgi:hypothetical protein
LTENEVDGEGSATAGCAGLVAGRCAAAPVVEFDKAAACRRSHFLGETPALTSERRPHLWAPERSFEGETEGGALDHALDGFLHCPFVEAAGDAFREVMLDCAPHNRFREGACQGLVDERAHLRAGQRGSRCTERAPSRFTASDRSRALERPGTPAEK